MEFEINIGISNKTMEFTGHWLSKVNSWEEAMKRATSYANVFLKLNNCDKVRYIEVYERISHEQ